MRNIFFIIYIMSTRPHNPDHTNEQKNLRINYKTVRQLMEKADALHPPRPSDRPGENTNPDWSMNIPFPSAPDARAANQHTKPGNKHQAGRVSNMKRKRKSHHRKSKKQRKTKRRRRKSKKQRKTKRRRRKN